MRFKPKQAISGLPLTGQAVAVSFEPLFSPKATSSTWSFRGLLLVTLVTACGEISSVDPDASMDVARSTDAVAAFEPIMIEAERFDSSEGDNQSNEWTLASDSTASGGTFIVVSADVSSCMVMATIDSCLPRVRYDFLLDRPGSFYVHISGMGTNPSADSSWYYTNTSSEAIAATWPLEAFSFSTQPQVALELSAGAHSLFIAHRERGTRIDVIAISDSATPPVMP